MSNEVKQAIQMYKDGEKIADIVEKFDRSEGWLYYHLNSSNVALNRLPNTGSHERIRILKGLGLRNVEIARDLGVSESLVSKVVKGGTPHLYDYDQIEALLREGHIARCISNVIGCKDGTPRYVAARREIDITVRRCTGHPGYEGTIHHAWAGNDVGRGPYHYKKKLARISQSCYWPLCPGKNSGGRHEWEVDHKITSNCQHENNKACWRCVRGRVHGSCNLEIRYWDWAMNQGLGPIPDGAMAYLLGSPLFTKEDDD